MPPVKQFDPTATAMTGLEMAISHLDGRLERIEAAITSLVRVEAAQVEHGRAMERAFAQIDEIRKEAEAISTKLHELRADFDRWEVARQLAVWALGLVGVPGVIGAAWYLAKTGGAG
jgi:chromosome segregation ATPase